MIRLWKFVNKQKFYIRLPVKGLLLAVVLLFVLFPNPNHLATQFHRWSDPESLIEPDHPTIQEWTQEILDNVPDNQDRKVMLHSVEHFVYDKVPYAWDWDVWGSADYFPTVTEVIEAGREDCDGRAIIAASILKNMGYDPHLVCDSMHVWVHTQAGDTMGPGKEAIAQSTAKGEKPRFNWKALTLLPRTTGFGIAVFPLVRELIVLAAFIGIMIHPRQSVRWRILGTILMLCALLSIRYFGRNYQQSMQWGLWAAYALAGVSLLIFWFSGSRKPKPSMTEL